VLERARIEPNVEENDGLCCYVEVRNGVENGMTNQTVRKALRMVVLVVLAYAVLYFFPGF
jgi:hypothetical protein